MAKKQNAPNGCAVGAFYNRDPQRRLGFEKLSDLGDVGIRTRVLQDVSRSSPSAACFVFLSPGDHAGKTPTGSVTV
jgi:hypothetical protein